MLDADFAGTAPLLNGLAPDGSGSGEDMDVGTAATGLSWLGAMGWNGVSVTLEDCTQR